MQDSLKYQDKVVTKANFYFSKTGFDLYCNAGYNSPIHVATTHGNDHKIHDKALYNFYMSLK